ncbi:MAG: hypothetical protein AAB602_01015, partial [Patescibacteria group bacterium]
MITSCEPWSIVLVPYPLTAFAAFAWYAISELLPVGGLVREKRFFRWINSASPRGELHSPHGVVLNLNAQRTILETELLRWLKSPLATIPNKRSAAIRDFVSYQGKRRFMLATLEERLSALSETQNPEVILDFSNTLFRKLVDEQIDPRVTAIDLPTLPEQSPQPSIPKIPGLQVVTIPFVKKRGMFDSITEHREATDFSIKHLEKRKVFRLLSEHILLVIGGPSGSGKSTLVTSLFIEVTNIISSLVSHEGQWKELKLVVDITDDMATPVASSILSRAGQDRDAMRLLKREWTMELAAESITDAAKRLESAHLVIAGLPGKITEITEYLSTHASFGGIITN